MEAVFMALLQLVGGLFTGPGSPTDFRSRPWWQRILLTLVALAVAVAAAALLTLFLLVLYAVASGIFRGLSS